MFPGIGPDCGTSHNKGVVIVPGPASALASRLVTCTLMGGIDVLTPDVSISMLMLAMLVPVTLRPMTSFQVNCLTKPSVIKETRSIVTGMSLPRVDSDDSTREVVEVVSLPLRGCPESPWWTAGND